MDPYDEYFTEVRLQGYRQLHDRYPLWCGHWPQDLRILPSGTDWTTDGRIDAVLEDPPEEFFSVSFKDDPSRNSVTKPTFYWRLPQDGPALKTVTTQVCDPPIMAVLIAAIHYTFLWWGQRTDGRIAPQEPPSIYEKWLDRLEEVFADEPKQFGLRSRLRRALRDPSKLNHLKRCWVEIGEEVGVIPNRRGGQMCALPNEFLANLQSEAQNLVKKLLRYSPSPNEKRSVQKILAIEDSEASTPSAARLDHSPDSPRVTDWCRRLAFPMLTRQEIGRVFERTGGELHKQQIDAAATDLLDERLWIERNTILNRIGPHRD